MAAYQPDHPRHRPVPVGTSEALRRRRSGLRHVRGVTRWAAAGSAVSAVLLGLGYAHALPHLPPSLTHPDSDSGSGAGNGSGSGGVQPPAQPGGGTAHTVTGGS